MLQHRAEFDAAVTFTGGGGLQAQGFRVDVPHADVTEAEVAAVFVAELRLPPVARVDLSGIRIFAEPVVPTGPRAPAATRFVELSHVNTDGLTAHPDHPPTAVTGADLAGLPLERLADVPAVVVRTAGTGRRAVDVRDLEPYAVAGRAVLLHTGAPEASLTADGARWLVEHGAALVGTDAPTVDEPAHTLLLAAGIPVVEHLTGLADLPPAGARFTAVPPPLIAVGTFPVRAYATVPAIEPHDHRRSAGWLPAAGS